MAEPRLRSAIAVGDRRGRLFALAVVGLVVVSGAWAVRAGFGANDVAPPPRSPADARQQELLQRNIGLAGDPPLGARYQEIASRHFSGALLPIPVRWEPGLAEVGSLTGRAFTLQGMYGHLGSRSVILLNPELQHDAASLDRALCHEMVHAYLHVTGDPTTDHGPAFQMVLQRLAREGVFEGLPSSPEERVALGAWLDAESARLSDERQTLDRLGADLERDGSEIAQAVEDVQRGGRTARAASLVATNVEARRQAYNQRALDANARSARLRADLEHFNREARRYHLMLVYPDGIEAGTHQDSVTGAGAP